MQQKMSRIKQVVFVALAIQLAVIILLQLIFKINILEFYRKRFLEKKNYVIIITNKSFRSLYGFIRIYLKN